MNDTAAVTKTPTTLELDGQEYILHPLTFRDFGKIDQYGREELLRATRRSIATENEYRKEDGQPPLSESEKRLQWAEAYDSAARVSVMTPQGRAFLSSSEGVMRIVWLSIRKGEPGLTLDEAEARMPINAGAMGEMSSEIMIISGLIDRAKLEDPEKLAELAEGGSGNVEPGAV